MNVRDIPAGAVILELDREEAIQLERVLILAAIHLGQSMDDEEADLVDRIRKHLPGSPDEVGIMADRPGPTEFFEADGTFNFEASGAPAGAEVH